MANPNLLNDLKEQLIKQLMVARSGVRTTLRNQDDKALAASRHAVNTAKIALGERGPVWWDDGSPDLNRHMVKNTLYLSIV